MFSIYLLGKKKSHINVWASVGYAELSLISFLNLAVIANSKEQFVLSRSIIKKQFQGIGAELKILPKLVKDCTTQGK